LYNEELQQEIQVLTRTPASLVNVASVDEVFEGEDSLLKDSGQCSARTQVIQPTVDALMIIFGRKSSKPSGSIYSLFLKVTGTF
jgi:hypothetical protein